MSPHKGTGNNTNMGPVTEHLDLSSDEHSSDGDMPELLEYESSSDEGKNEDIWKSNETAGGSHRME